MKILSDFKIAAVQDTPVFLDIDASVNKACNLITVAAENGASLVLFPEAFISGYPDWVWLLPAANKAQINSLYTEFLGNAITIPDEYTKRLCEAAQKSKIYIAIGVNERNSESSNSSVFNTLLYINSEGQILGKHRKLIPTGGERLMWSSGAGDTLVSFDSLLGKLGGLICWENYMPFARCVMYQAGVQIYLAPTWDNSENWQIAMRHIAREGGMFVISCASAMKISDVPDRFEFKKLYPQDREWINKGNSCIVDPSGKFLVEPMEGKQGIIYADVNLKEISSQKWLFDVAGHYSRPDIFDFKVKD
jgi:nitrilase